MSKYIPYASVVRETFNQAARKRHGLKTGEYVLYPDPAKGPYVVKATEAKRLNALKLSGTTELSPGAFEIVAEAGESKVETN